MASTNNFSVVIDIGTSKIVALAGLKNEDGKIEIKGLAKIPSKGIKRGVVFNIDEVAASVSQVLKILGTEFEGRISKVDVAFAGQHIKTMNYRGYRFTSGDGVVSKSDILELYTEAKNLKIEQDYKILHVIPQSYVIDEEVTDFNPVGISGRKIEANYKLLVIPEVYLINLQRVFDKIGIQLGDVTLSPLAISEAVLTKDEKEIGAIVLDIGAGLSKLAVYHDNILLHTAVVPFGGSVVTKDIKEGCSILLKVAERIKMKYGQALGDFADEQKVVTIPGSNGWESKEISFKSLAFIIQARMEEIIDSIYLQIEKSDIEGRLGAGIVVTGGTSNLENIVSLVKFRTGMDARAAFPVFYPVNYKKEFQDQECLTALGLLKLSLNKAHLIEKQIEIKPKEIKPKVGPSSLKKVVDKVLKLFDDENEDLVLN